MSLRSRIPTLFVRLFAIIVFFLPTVILGQTAPNPAAPALNPIFPAGMQRGATLELTLTGKNLAEPTGIVTTFPAKVEIPKDKNNGGKATQLRVRLTVPADVPIGWYGLRLATVSGMSNLRLFCIDSAPQVEDDRSNHSQKTAQKVPVPCVVAGQVDNLSGDFYRFSAKAGQSLSFEILGRRLGGPLDPQMSLFSASAGQQLFFAGDSPGLQTDCRSAYHFKESGDYIIRISDVLNRGGNDYIYRLRIGNFPLAAAALPMAGRRGGKASVKFSAIYPNQLPGIDDYAVPADPAQEAVWISPPENGWPVAMTFSEVDEMVEHEPNNDIAQANRVPLPSGVTGCFQKYGDVDRFRFSAKKGKKLRLQAHSLEQYSPALVYLAIHDAKGKQLAKSNPAAKRPADQRIDFTPPADGDFIATLQHLNYKGGPEQVYRLTLAPIEPDFSLTCPLDRWDAAKGSAQVLPLQISRSGYGGAIDVEAISSHPGISGKTVVGANAKSGQLVLRVKDDVPPGPVAFRLKATAKINGKTLTRFASVRASISSSLAGLPFPPLHLNNQLALAVTPKPPFRLQVAFAHPESVPGLNAAVTVTVERNSGFDEAVAVLPPAGVPGKVKFPKIKPIAKGKKSTKFAFKLDPKTPLGKHLLVFKAKAKVKGKDRYAQADPAALVVARPFALQVEPKAVTLQQGKKATIKIRAARKGGYDGPIKLQARNLPKGVKASAPTIAKGKSEAVIDITAAANAAVSASKNANILGAATAAGNQQQASPNFTIAVKKK